MKKVTVIISTYNRKTYIKNAIKSALFQTYPNIEIIVVDDNSDYNIFSYLDEYKNKIQIIRNQKNLGSSATYNIGIKKSTGDYVTILNDDDIFHPKKVERQIRVFNKNHTLDVVYCPIGILINNYIIFRKITQNNPFSKLTHKSNICITPLIKKELLSDENLFDENLNYHEDRDLWYRLSKICKFGVDNYPSYIEYNLKIQRLSSQIENIHKSKKALYEKHKSDFKNHQDYFS
jgi:glycosyltransferase involved in cell wall biosynthesis